MVECEKFYFQSQEYIPVGCVRLLQWPPWEKESLPLVLGVCLPLVPGEADTSWADTPLGQTPHLGRHPCDLFEKFQKVSKVSNSTSHFKSHLKV